MHSNYLINLKSISITAITLYILTASLYTAVFNSLVTQIVILVSILSVLLINECLLKGSFLIKKSDVLFLLAMIAVVGSLQKFTLVTGEIADSIVICLGIIISIFIRGNVENYNTSFMLIKWGGVFYALSVILTYLSPSLYQKIFLSLLRPEIAENILRSLANGYYTGFTGQVAYTAGYIVSAIGVIFCGWIVNRKRLSPIEMLLFIILFLGLLLTQKRAHLLFLFITFIVVYIQFSKNLTVRLIKTFRTTVFVVLVIIPIASIISITRIGQVLFNRIFDTIHAFSQGEDISSDRINLWEYAWETFLEYPIFGIGWGNFRESIVGTVTVYTEMETHNIYLQLLSETGIVGTIMILSPFIITYIYTLKATRIINRNKNSYPFKWKFAVTYSLFIQTFFLWYGLTGNPLYDYSYLIMYFLSFGLIYSYWQFTQKTNKIQTLVSWDRK